MTEEREREIRAVLADWYPNGAPVPRDVLNRIRAILDSAPPAIVGGEPLEPLVSTATTARRRDVHITQTPAPRVFFPGDTVPAGTFVLDRRGGVITGNGVVMPSTEPWLVQGETWTFVELQHPSPEDWQATVDRAHQARLAEATAQPLLSDPGTGEA